VPNLIELNLIDLANAIATRQVSARDTVAAFTQRNNQLADDLHAFEQTFDQRADDLAAKVDAGDITGPLAGVPIAIKDLGSGLASQSIKVTLDGQPLIVEPDLPRDRLLVTFPDLMLTGSHQLSFEVADKAGHVTRWQWDILAQ